MDQTTLFTVCGFDFSLHFMVLRFLYPVHMGETILHDYLLWLTDGEHFWIRELNKHGTGDCAITKGKNEIDGN